MVMEREETTDGCADNDEGEEVPGVVTADEVAVVAFDEVAVEEEGALVPSVPASVPIVGPDGVGVDGVPPPPGVEEAVAGADVSICVGTTWVATGVVAGSSPIVSTTLGEPVPSARMACRLDELPMTDPSSEKRDGGGAGGGGRRRLGVTSDRPRSRPRRRSR